MNTGLRAPLLALMAALSLAVSTQVNAGSSHTCGIRTNGTTACWGWNQQGQTNVPPQVAPPDDFDPPLDFLLKQLAYQFPLANTGGELSNSRTALLPHQILLTHDVVAATRRRFLIADEVGLGKTISAGLIIRQALFARSRPISTRIARAPTATFR